MDLLSHRRTWSLLGAAALLLLTLAIACGGGGAARQKRGPLPGPAGRLDPIYDATILFPDDVVIVGGLEHHGIALDIAITFDDAGLRDGDPRFTAPVGVVGVTAGGVAQAPVMPRPILLEGTIDGDAFQTDLFGPIQFGTANLILSLAGAIAPDRRSIAGEAALFGTSSRGTFTAVKRRRYLVAGTDLQTIGEAAVVGVRYGAQFDLDENLETTSSDPVARVEDGRPFVVNRLSFDNLQGLDPARRFLTTFQYSTGNGSNPHDLVVLPDEKAGLPAPAAGTPSAGVAFVTRYEPPYDDVALVDLDDGALLGSIDLVPFALNPDRLPRPDQILLHGGLLYVTLQDANRSFTQFMNGRVAVIDPALREVVDVIDLAGQNPFESLVDGPGTGLIYVGLAGIFPGLRPQALTGGIEAIDPATRRSIGLVVDDDALGGNVSAVAIVSAERGYAVVTDATFRNFVKAFDPSTGEVLGSVFETQDRIAALVSDGDGWLLIADSSFTAPRLLVLDGQTAQPLASLPLRLPPLSVAILTRSL